MKVLITGAGGQLGRLLARTAPPDAEVVSLDHGALDISDPAAVNAAMEGHTPDLVINAAAYTAVDRAESEPERARAVNTAGPALIARALAPGRGRLLHVSTDYVFDGERGRPYTPGDETRPLGVYGRTKLEGEQAVLETLDRRVAILRSSWLYAATGRNFLTTMLGLMSKRDEIRVVSDQVSAPTWAGSVAEALWRLADLGTVSGVLHWSDAGVASWYDFAVAIAEEASALGRIPGGTRIMPIPSSEYPTAARRPAYSVLDTWDTRGVLGLKPVHWRARLRRVLGEGDG